ncbi:hypothetical protein PF005_g16041 [Phytophthora fragariae]|uniref:Uncharacterized protein n=1 Tax=Phytophthora fragariae TaxID=53985 RepID=A0A6A3TB46_9STRA|nr:hypothetical protein PF003_g32648 [Phytophthora fragariae]KAE8932923.1 hypothetical protein PF009_g17062 [Phytophthora fragariae]KAE8998451.1 hypothetical protein PF011_g15053 [Phytophthora fragariae]KAE9098276.1 hypothetical protein PF007_g16335 [Phytophthora fragariae]KAE9098459.1 hypothetical protein PF010_g15563 [Phytophthora fragariae]
MVNRLRPPGPLPPVPARRVLATMVATASPFSGTCTNPVHLVNGSAFPTKCPNQFRQLR